MQVAGTPLVVHKLCISHVLVSVGHALVSYWSRMHCHGYAYVDHALECIDHTLAVHWFKHPLCIGHHYLREKWDGTEYGE